MRGAPRGSPVGRRHPPSMIPALRRSRRLRPSTSVVGLTCCSPPFTEQSIIHLIRDRVLQGIPYSGASHGANVACPTMQTTNDMPSCTHLPSMRAGHRPIPDQPPSSPGEDSIRTRCDLDHHGETRAKAHRGYHREADLPVIGLWEGAVLRWDGPGFRTLLHGRGTILRKGSHSMLVEAPSSTGTCMSDDVSPPTH